MRLFSASPLSPPAMLTSVGTQSSDANMSFFTVPGRMVPGQRTSERRAHAAFPGGQLAALEGRGAAVREGDGLGAVVGGEDDDRVVELAHVFELLEHDADVVIDLLHAGFVEAPVLAAGLTHHAQVFVGQHGRDVHACRVVPDEERLVGPPRIVAVEEVDDLGGDFLVHGLRALQRQRTLILAGLICGSAVGGPAPQHRARGRQTDRRLGVHGAGNLGEARDRRIAARRRDRLLGRGLVDVGEAHPLHGVKVVEVAPELVEAVGGRQGVGVVAQVVLAELAGVVAEIAQEPGDRRRTGPQVGRAAWQLRRDHAGAQRMHAGEEGVAPGGAALLGVIVHEDRTFVADAIDVGRFPDHQAAVIDARLHDADVVAHDEEDVGLLLLLRGRRQCSPPSRRRTAPASRAISFAINSSCDSLKSLIGWFTRTAHSHRPACAATRSGYGLNRRQSCRPCTAQYDSCLFAPPMVCLLARYSVGCPSQADSLRPKALREFFHRPRAA